MCLLVVAFHALPDRPIAVAANRDEYYDRPTAPPGLLCESPRVFGGRDQRAGGTWLGINEHGVIAALTNRYVARPDKLDLPSRGQLCLAALKNRTAHAAAHDVAQLIGDTEYNPFSLLAISVAEAWLVSNVDAHIPLQLKSGWYLLANSRLNDPEDPRVRRADTLLSRNTYILDGLYPASLARLCSDHGTGSEPGAADAVCTHEVVPGVGTRSSTLIAVDDNGRTGYWHAEGPPCSVPYTEYALPWGSRPPAG